MKSMRVLVPCLITALALSTVSATSAFADLLFVPQKGTFPFLATSLLTGGKFQIGGGWTMECSNSYVDTQITDAHLGKLHLLWLGCKNGSVACQTSGQADGRVLLSMVFHLGLGHREIFEFKVPTILILIPIVNIYCTIPILLEGNAIGEVVPSNGLNKQSSKINFYFRQTAGAQEMTSFLLSKLTNQELMTAQRLILTIFMDKEQAGIEADAELKNPAGETLEIKEK